MVVSLELTWSFSNQAVCSLTHSSMHPNEFTSPPPRPAPHPPPPKKNLSSSELTLRFPYKLLYFAFCPTCVTHVHGKSRTVYFIITIKISTVRDRVERLAQLIVSEFGDSPLICLCVLKGGHQFFADLIDHIKRMNMNTPQSVRLEIDFIRLKSYENESSSGTVRIIGGDDLSRLNGKNILIVEDMIDTGRTMVKLLDTLKAFSPAVVRVASLFVKRTPLSNGYRPDYIGFELPNHFIVGYALDYNEHFRDLPHVCILNEHGKVKYRE